MLHNYKILIIDDDDTIQAMILSVLELFHANSFEAVKTHNEAIDLLREKNFDFIILDLNLKNGVENTNGVKVIEYLASVNSTIPVLIFSAFASSSKNEIILKTQRKFVISFLEKNGETMVYDLITAIGTLKDTYECKKLKHETIPKLEAKITSLSLKIDTLENETWHNLSRQMVKNLSDKKVTQAIVGGILTAIAWITAKLT